MMKQFGAVAIVLGCLVLLGCGGLGNGGGDGGLFVESVRRAKLVDVALHAYMSDHDDVIPLPDVWMDAIAPYGVQPADLTSPALDGTGQFGYALNEDVAGRQRNSFEDSTVLMFDSTVTVWNASASTSTLPSPPRYGAYNTILFMDGTIADEPPPTPEEQLDVAMDRVRMTSLGIQLYAGDYDDFAPPASTWMDATLPYVKNKEVFRSPAFHLEKDKYGVAFLAALSSANLSTVADPAGTFLLFDSTLLGWNASGDPATRPVPGRHFGSNVFSFVDGHVEHD